MFFADGKLFCMGKPEELTLVRQLNFQANFQANFQPNIGYKQNVFQSLSQLPLTALFTKESLAIRSA